MIIKDEFGVKTVLCMMEDNESVTLFTGGTYLTRSKAEINVIKYGDIPYISETLFKGRVVKYYSEIDDIPYEMFEKMVSVSFSSDEEKEEHNKKFDEIKVKFLQIQEEVIRKYYRDKIKNNEFEIWKNAFDDKIFKISDNETYIDDKDYDIFYKIKSDGEYEFKFYDK